MTIDRKIDKKGRSPGLKPRMNCRLFLWNNKKQHSAEESNRESRCFLRADLKQIFDETEGMEN